MKVWRQLKVVIERRADAAHRPMVTLWQRYFAAYLEPRMPAEAMLSKIDAAMADLGMVQVPGDPVRWQPKPA